MTVEEAVKSAYEAALDNGYTFKNWTADMLADDMICYDADVEHLADNFGRDAVVAACAALGELK